MPHLQHARGATPEPTISAFAREVDAARYVCSDGLARRTDQLLSPDGWCRVLVVSGPAGSGKSAALREVARRATSAGWWAVLHERGIDPAGIRDEVERFGRRPTVLLVDDADGGGALAELASQLETLPASARIVLATGGSPGRWSPGPLDRLTSALRLTHLDRAASDDLLSRHGVETADVRAAIGDWAGGLPLALALGAAAWTPGMPLSHLAAALEGPVIDELIERLGGAELADLDPDLVTVTALAGGADPGLLEAVLPKIDVTQALVGLRSQPSAERAGGRVAFHQSLAAVLGVRARTDDPLRTELLTMRVAAHLRARAVESDVSAVVRLGGLVRDPLLRAGLAPPLSASHYADRPRPGDGEAFRAGLRRLGRAVSDVVVPWLEVEGVVNVVRRHDGTPVAAVAVLPLARAAGLPPACRRLVAPVVEHAEAVGLTDRAVLTAWQVVLDDGLGDPDVVRIRNAVALQRCGVANPRIDLVGQFADDPAESEVLAAYGYVRVPELDRTSAGAPIRTWVADTGAGGLAGLLYDAIALEQGRSPVLTGAGPELLLAVESFHDDAVLAGLSVAPEGLDEERAAERVREWARATVAEVLEGEPALSDLVRRRYLAPDGTHESAMRDTFASRATYFRRLRRARDLLSALPTSRSASADRDT